MLRSLFIFMFVMILASFKGARETAAFAPVSDTCFYAVSCPADMDIPTTPHFDTTIIRGSNCKVQMLRLPGWGTSTTYELHSVNSAVDVFRATSFNAGKKGLIDISDIPAGEYTVRLMACGNGGSFGLKIK